MGTGIHGKNGINPVISRKIWERYNIPRSTHGLEVQIMSETEMNKLLTHEREYLKMFQSLPKFAPNILSYILVGGTPVEVVIHKRMLSLLMNVRRKDCLEADIGRRQLAMKSSSSQSWFFRVNRVANYYGLPNSYTVMDETAWDKKKWKAIVKVAITNKLEIFWRQEVSQLQSLSALNPGTIFHGKGHPAWTTADSPNACRQAISKIRFLTDTLMNGEKYNKFYNQSPRCICGHPFEDRYHMILDCNKYEDLREYCLVRMVSLITQKYPFISEEMIRQNRLVLANLFLDPTWYRRDIGSNNRGLPNVMTLDDTNDLEKMSRTFCYQIYRRRFSLLSEVEDNESETDDDDMYSLHDTSDDTVYSSSDDDDLLH